MRTISGARPKSTALAVEVRIPAEGRAFAALANQLSLEAVFVSTFHNVREGASVIVELTLPNGTARAEGTVARVCDPKTGAAGFSVAFNRIARQDHERIAEAVGSRNAMTA